jgi:hypothetical protein
MVINFRAGGISRGTRKLARTPTSIKKKLSLLLDKRFFCPFILVFSYIIIKFNYVNLVFKHT